MDDIYIEEKLENDGYFALALEKWEEILGNEVKCTGSLLEGICLEEHREHRWGRRCGTSYHHIF